MNRVVVHIAVLGLCACTTPAPPRPAPPPKGGVKTPWVRSTLTVAGIDPKRLSCTDAVRWVPKLNDYADAVVDKIGKLWGSQAEREQRKKAARIVLGYLVRTVFEQNNLDNLGVMRLKGHWYEHKGRKRPLLIFRSRVATNAKDPASCFRSLIDIGNVKHIINLYSGSFPLHDFIDTEKRVAMSCGVSHSSIAGPRSEWRSMIRTKASYKQNRGKAVAEVARIINEQILRPRGAAPVGNIYVHCGGGMHRSGIVFGVLRRCINGDPLSKIEAEYKHHTDYRGHSAPGGYEELNLRFIREFECAKLNPITVARRSN